jgi:hypothetical protein
LAQETLRAVTVQRRATPLPKTVSHRSLAGYASGLLTAAEAVPREQLAPRTFTLPLLDLTVWFANASFAEFCSRRLMRRPVTEQASAQATVFAMDATRGGWPAPLRWHEADGFASREFERILADAGWRGFYEHDAPSWQIFNPARRLGVQSLMHPEGFPRWETGSPLRLFLHWAYAATNCRMTHAAALGANGRGALLVGPSGAGKSATALAGLLNGLECAGDDYVMLEATPVVSAHAIFRLVKQDREGLARNGITHPAATSAAPNWHGKIEIDPAEIGLPALTPSMTIGALLIPVIARTERTSFQPASAREAALALAPSAVFQLPGDTNEGFTFFSAIVKQLPAYRMALSQQPAEIASAIGSFLADGRNLAG